MNKIVFPESIWNKVKIYLQSERYGNYIFFFCSVNSNKNGTIFLVKDYERIKDDEVEPSYDYGLQVKLSAIINITNKAFKEKLAIVEAHNHPFSYERVSFSYTDHEGFKEFVPYILDYLQRPYAAMVWSEKAVEGKMWKKTHTECENIHEIRVIGKIITKMVTASHKERRNPKVEDNRSNRQIMALGEPGNFHIKNTKVAIVGLGGIGSHVAQQLAYLGVRDFVLIDFDEIETENLNRIIGAYPKDVGKLKVDIAARGIRYISGKETNTAITLQTDLRHLDALDHMKNCDVIFGCVDNDGARLILNEFSKAYMIPYFDSAFGIHVENGIIKEAGGRVVLVTYDGPCLLCCKDIDIDEASFTLSTPDEQKISKERGYVSGSEITSPSITSLDGIMASIAVTEFLALVTGIRDAKQYLSYDFLKPELTKRIVKKDLLCLHCHLAGIGDAARLTRYFLNVPDNVLSTLDRSDLSQRNN